MQEDIHLLPERGSRIPERLAVASLPERDRSLESGESVGGSRGVIQSRHKRVAELDRFGGMSYRVLYSLQRRLDERSDVTAATPEHGVAYPDAVGNDRLLESERPHREIGFGIEP